MTETEPGPAGSRRVAEVVAAAALLTVGAVLLGARSWAVPTRTTSGWQVIDVPTGVLTLLIAVAVVSGAVAAVLVRPHRSGPLVAGRWWLLMAAAGAALVWNDLYLASLRGDGGIIPVFDWAFTFVPALLIGLLTRRSGRAAHLLATLGTGVLTLPLLGLGWALVSDVGFGQTVGNALFSAGLFGVVPLVIAVGVTVPPTRRSTPVG